MALRPGGVLFQFDRGRAGAGDVQDDSPGATSDCPRTPRISWPSWRPTNPGISPDRPSTWTAGSAWNCERKPIIPLEDSIMDKIIGGQLAAEALIARDVDYIFSLSGGHITPILSVSRTFQDHHLRYAPRTGGSLHGRGLGPAESKTRRGHGNGGSRLYQCPVRGSPVRGSPMLR